MPTLAMLLVLVWLAIYLETDTSIPSRAHGGGHLMPRRNRPALHGMNWRSFRRDPDAQHPHGAPGEIDEP